MCPSLPLPTPLPLPSPHTLYIQLLPLAYLAVCACEEDGEVITRCFLVKVAEGRVGGEGGGEQLSAVPSMPRIFPGIMCVAELDHSQLIGDSLRCIPGTLSLPLSLPPSLPPSLPLFLPPSLPPSLPLFLPLTFDNLFCSKSKSSSSKEKGIYMICM